MQENYIQLLEATYFSASCHMVKIILLVYKSLNGLSPTYLLDLFLTYKHSRALRSSHHTQSELKPTVRHHLPTVAHATSLHPSMECKWMDVN